LRRLRRAADALPALIGFVTTIHTSQTMLLYQSVRQSFAKELPELWAALKLRCERQDGTLFVEDRVRDLEAEARDDERHDRALTEYFHETLTEQKRLKKLGLYPRKAVRPLIKSVRRQFGIVSQRRLFLKEPPPKLIIGETLSELHRVREALSGGLDGGGYDKPDKTVSALNALLRTLEDQLDRLSELPAFFQPRVLALVTEWANRRRFAEMPYKAGLMCVVGRESDTVGVTKEFSVPSRSPLDTFRALFLYEAQAR
jgi:hypothetical protein